MRKLYIVRCLLVVGVLGIGIGGGWGQTTTRFNDGYLTVFKVTSVALLTNTGTAIVTEEYLPIGANQAVPNYSVSLPTTGANKVAVTGSGTSAGAMTRSENGRYLIIPGYYGTVGDANTWTVGAIRTLDASGVVGTGISGTFYTTANDFRGAISDDGTNYWMSGGSIGIRYSNNGTTVTTISITSTNTRVVNIFNGQLFYSTSGGTNGIYKVSNGKTTTTGQTSVLQASSTAPYGFAVSPDGLTIYAFSSANTIARFTYSGTYNSSTFTYSGGSWSIASTGFTLTGATGVAVDWNGYSFTTSANGAVVYACNPTTLVKGTDNGTGAISTTILRTVSGNNAFRGLAFSPVKQTVIKGANTPAASNVTAGASDAVLFQFNLSADEGNSTIRKVIVNQSGTATIGTGNSIDNFKLYSDPNGDGLIADGALLSTGTASGTSITFSSISQTYINQGSSNNYLVIGDVSTSGTGTFIPAIVSNKTINSVNYTTNLYNAGGSSVNIGATAPTGNTLTITAASSPTVTTDAAPSATTSTSATLGGNVTTAGSFPISDNGLVYSQTSTNATPSIAGTGVIKLPYSTPGTGAFSVSTGTGLSVNTQYSYRAYATNDGTTYSYGGASGTTFYTLANVPAAPTVDGATSISLNVTVNVNGNPSNTEFTMYESTTGLYVQADGSLAAAAVWQTASVWGTKTVTGLNSTTTYTFAVKARNTPLTETGLSATTSLATLACPTVSGLAVSGITNSGATVSWSGTASAYEYLVTTSSADPANGSGTVVTTTADFAGGLLANTNYYLHVHAKCGTGYSAWVTSDPFTTDNAPTGLITWVPSGLTNYGPNTFAPTFSDGRLTVTELTRGSAVSTNTSGHTAAASAWGGYGWDGTANKDVQFSVKVNTGYILSLSSIQLSYRRSPTGPSSGTLAYSTDNVTFNTLTTWNFSSSASAGAQLPAVNLSATPALQSSGSTTTIYFKIVPTGGDVNGTWYVYNEGLLVNGIINPAIQAPVAAAGTNVNPACFTANWATIAGATGYFVDVYKDGASFDPNFSTIAGWDFGSNLNSNSGIPGNLNMPLTSVGTNPPAIVGETARADAWDNGNGTKYWETHFSTTGYANTKVYSNQRSSPTGPKDFQLQYKIGVGGTYANVPGSNPIVLANDYISGSIFNVALPASCDNVPAVYLRWIMTSNNAVTGGSVASLGASNIDDIVITANAGLSTQYVFQNLTAGNVTSLNISPLMPNTKYYYVVRASNGITSSNSNVVTVITTDQTTVDYRSKRTGNYSDATMWEYDRGTTCGAGWLTATIMPGAANNVNILSNHVATLDANATVGTGKTITINSLASLITNDKVISGAGAFTLTSGGKISVGSSNGITVSTAAGNVQVTGTRTYSKSADYTYNGTLAQVTGDALPDSVNAFTVANSVTLTNPLTVIGALNLSSSSLAINGKTLTSSGSFSGPGLLSGSSTSSLVIDGTGAIGNLYMNQITDSITNVLNSFTVNRTGATVVLANRMYITNVLTSLAGTLNANNYLTLRSTSIAATARVAPVTGTLSGNVTVERFMSGRRAFRFVSPSVNSSGSIKSNWMEGVNNTSPYSNINPNPGYGTQITGNLGATNGFDPSPTNNPSLFTFSNATQIWSAVPNTSALLTAGSAWRLFIRGDRSHLLASNPADSSTAIIRATGPLYTGTFVLNSTAGSPMLSPVTGGYSFIGNPYASPVSWHDLVKPNPLAPFQSTGTAVNISASYYAYDPHFSRRGGYISYNGVLGTNNNPTKSAVSDNIQSGQAFFIQNDGLSPSLQFQEGYKSIGNTLVSRTPADTTKMVIELQLNNNDVADACIVVFDDIYPKTVGNEDSRKLPNPDENLAIIENGTDLSIEGRPFVSIYDTVFLKLWQLSEKNYYLHFTSQNFAPGLDAFLKDSYLNTESQINLSDTTLLSFDLTTDSASFALNRFMILFRPSASLPVTVTNLKAYQREKGIQVEWISRSELNIESYTIEKSQNGQQFSPFANVKAKGNNGSTQNYSWFDNDPQPGSNFYRIRITDKSGLVKYTEIVKVNIAESESGIAIYPNPAKGKTFGLQFTNMEKGKYSITLFNNLGQKVYSGSVVHDGGSGTYSIETNRPVSTGSYRLSIRNGAAVTNATLIFE